jgi:NAD-dependent deacetylase
MLDLSKKNIEKAIELLKKAKHITAFTGAGISVESGIPPYRGEGGLWSKQDPRVLELNYFKTNPEASWKVIREIFFNYFSDAKPNAAHLALAEMEEKGNLKAIITQNIDNLHQEAGSKTVYEFHGNAQKLSCLKCGKSYDAQPELLKKIPPRCTTCQGILRPDFIFFGEQIPQEAYKKSEEESKKADVFILAGTSGVVVPAALIPQYAKQNGAVIIEVNPERTAYSESITDIFIKGKAGEILEKISKALFA